MRRADYLVRVWRACRLSILLLVLGCPRRDATTDPVPGLLAQADALWADRASTGLEPVERVLLEAWGLQSENPEVLWRLVRLKTAQGMVESERGPARYAFAEARGLGVQCLDGDAGFRQQRVAVSWEAAVERIPLEREACAAWTALAWARWLEVHGGEAGALDLETLDPLVAVLDGDGPEGVAAWAEGLLAAVRPTWAGRDLARARRRLEVAVAEAPDELVRRVDLFTHVEAHDDDASARREALLGRRADTPEDRAARARLEAAAPTRVAHPTATE